MGNLYMTGNTHFDPVWLWRWDEAMASIRATFRSALDRMNENPDFYYTFATPPVFEWIKKTDPEMFEEIKQRVKEGRWDISEGFWVQPDCFSATGESYARQGLYGQRYLKENFGKTTEVVFNVDSFGHPASFPQILNKCGIKYYCFVRPEKHHIELELPLFKWTGIDGSSLSAFRYEDAYIGDIKERMENLHKYPIDVMGLYGVTDHGGAPTKHDIKVIHETDYAHLSDVPSYFENNKPTWEYKGELLTGDFGVYANQPRVKKLNRTAEYALLNAEKTCVFSGRNYQEKLSERWKDVLFNQFHDILGGASIKDAYIDSNNLNGGAISDAEMIMHTNLQFISKDINTPGKNGENEWNVVLWNLNGFDFDGYVEAEAQWAHEFEWYDKGITLRDEKGDAVKCQIMREKSVVPQFRSRFLFKAKIPAFGYKTYAVVKDNEDIVTNKIENPYKIKTNCLEAEISEKDGGIKYVKSLKSGNILYKNIMRLCTYFDDGDTWAFNIEDYGEELKPFEIDNVFVEESGELRTVIKLVLKYESSIAEIWYDFYNNEEYFDVRYRINWNEKHTVVKLVSEISDMKHIASTPYGSVERAGALGDRPMGEWLKTSDFSVASNSVFAYSIKDNELGLTLFRNAIFGDFRLGGLDYSVDYDIMDIGVNEGLVRIGKNCDEEKLGTALNNPPVVILEGNHQGRLSPCDSYIKWGAEHTKVTVLKYSEDSDKIIIRMCEYRGEKEKFEFELMGNSFKAELLPYEIKTFEVTENNIKEINITEL